MPYYQITDDENIYLYRIVFNVDMGEGMEVTTEQSTDSSSTWATFEPWNGDTVQQVHYKQIAAHSAS